VNRGYQERATSRLRFEGAGSRFIGKRGAVMSHETKIIRRPGENAVTMRVLTHPEERMIAEIYDCAHCSRPIDVQAESRVLARGGLPAIEVHYKVCSRCLQLHSGLDFNVTLDLRIRDILAHSLDRLQHGDQAAQQ
jgi:hypothetical protein